MSNENTFSIIDNEVGSLNSLHMLDIRINGRTRKKIFSSVIDKSFYIHETICNITNRVWVEDCIEETFINL